MDKDKLVFAYASAIESAVKVVLSVGFSVWNSKNHGKNEKFSYANILNFFVCVAMFHPDALFIIGLLGIIFFVKLICSIRRDPKKKHVLWIFFLAISIIYQIYFSYQTFKSFEVNESLKMIVFIYTLVDVFVLFSILIFVTSNDSSSLHHQLNGSSGTFFVDIPPPSYENATRCNT